jgi:hypothetical protein
MKGDKIIALGRKRKFPILPPECDYLTPVGPIDPCSERSLLEMLDRRLAVWFEVDGDVVGLAGH